MLKEIKEFLEFFELFKNFLEFIKKIFYTKNYLGFILSIFGIFSAIFGISDININQTIYNYIKELNVVDSSLNEKSIDFQNLFQKRNIIEINKIKNNSKISKETFNKLLFIEAEILYNKGNYDSKDINKLCSLYKRLLEVNDYIDLNNEHINIAETAQKRLDIINISNPCNEDSF